MNKKQFLQRNLDYLSESAVNQNCHQLLIKRRKNSI